MHQLFYTSQFHINPNFYWIAVWWTYCNSTHKILQKLQLTHKCNPLYLLWMFSVLLMTLCLMPKRFNSIANILDLRVFALGHYDMISHAFLKFCLVDENTWYIWNTICLENNWVMDRLYVETGQPRSFNCMHQDQQASTGIPKCIIMKYCHDEFNLWKIKVYFHFSSLHNTEMARVVGTLLVSPLEWILYIHVTYCHATCWIPQCICSDLV